MKNIDNQVAFWDGVSKSKTFSHPIDQELLLKLAPLDSRVLDYGCGYGRVCNDLSQIGYKNILGVDTSLNMVRRGQKEYPKAQLKYLPDTHTELEKNSFDVITLFAVLTCIPTNDGQSKLINHLYDLLAPGGLLYISDYWLQSDQRNQTRYGDFSKKHSQFGVFELSKGSVVRHHSKEWIASLLERFEIIHSQDHVFDSMNGNSSSCFQMIGRK